MSLTKRACLGLSVLCLSSTTAMAFPFWKYFVLFPLTLVSASGQWANVPDENRPILQYPSNCDPCAMLPPKYPAKLADPYLQSEYDVGDTEVQSFSAIGTAKHAEFEEILTLDENTIPAGTRLVAKGWIGPEGKYAPHLKRIVKVEPPV